MAHLLGAEGLHLEYPTKVVFDSVSLGVGEGDRIGVVGRNGDGKSSLAAMLAGRLAPDAGRVTRRSGVTVGMLDQADRLDDDDTVGHAVVGDAPEYVWASDARVRGIIEALLGEVAWDARLGALSGGQRRRVALARVLAGDYDVLALDEPTNHLDVEAITWLADHLRHRWAANAGGLLLVTHDRWILDEVCTTTWEVHDRVVEPFDGGYAAYILQRVERDRMAAAAESRRQNLARKELAWLRRGAPARTAKPKFRIAAANALIADEPEIRQAVQLRSLAVARLGKNVVDLVDASVSFDYRAVLREVEWRIAPGERTGILGVNGAGKSTLLGLVDGSVQPSAGRVTRGTTVRCATLTQRLDELAEHLDEPVRTVLAGLRTSYTLGSGAKAKELTPAQLLERLGFAGTQLSTPVRDLSGGQQRRLQLLLVLLAEPNVLLLDEPTNDMDTDMLTAMEDLLDSWPGTLLVVSHDRYFLERVTDQQYAILDGRLRHLPGGVDEYLRLRQQGRAPARPAPGRVPSGSAAREDAAQAGGAAGLSGAEEHALRKELGAAERKVARLGERMAEIRDRMTAHDPSDYEGLGRLGEELRAAEAEKGALEERWFELSEIVG